ncbi:MAM and LDL-receptor class A domain-containing protein 1 [Nymphon striatum]|nr:MAM and LDL-receptor class A domain-containing protein 1 [Nymphon striatum]
MRFYYATSSNYESTKEQLQVAIKTSIEGEPEVIWSSPREELYFSRTLSFTRKVIKFDISEPFQVIFLSEVQSKTAVAIDDVSFSDDCKHYSGKLPEKPVSKPPKTCPLNLFQCKTSLKCIPKSQICNFVDNCGDGDNSDEEYCISCNFENGPCGWFTNKHTHEYKWKLVEASSYGSKPHVDETTNLGKGHFMGTTARKGSPFSGHDTLISEYFGPTGPQCTLILAYYVPADKLKSSLSLHVRIGNTVKQYNHFNERSRWALATISLANLNERLQIFISAVGGFIAIDDISLSNCGPNSPIMRNINCNFDNGTCDWIDKNKLWIRLKPSPNKLQGPGLDYQSKKGTTDGVTDAGIAIDEITYSQKACPQSANECDFEGKSITWYDPNQKWKVTDGKKLKEIPYDHTYQTNLGKYAVFAGIYGNLGDATLRSSEFTIQKEEQCFSFWYILHGNSSALSVFLTYDNEGGKDKVLLYEKAQSSLYIKASVDDTSSAVAVDDLKHTPEPCSSPNTCDFETGFCSWVNGGVDFKWLRMTPSLPVSIGGPKYDATTESADGWYLVVDASGNHNKKALLESELLPYSDELCIGFKYYIYGKDVGSLSLLLKTSRHERLITNITSLSESEKWQTYIMQLEKSLYPIISNSKYQIVFKAEIGNGMGYIAIDDVIVKKDCHLVTTPPPTTLPPPELSNCDFEAACPWKFINWKTFQPDNECHYAIAETSKTSKHILRSPLMTVSNEGLCLKFWYFIGSMSKNTSLSVNLLSKDAVSPKLFWIKYGRQSITWSFAQITLKNTTIHEPDYYIEFVAALHATNGKEAISIDDITIDKGECLNKGYFECDFETGDCGLISEPDNSFGFTKTNFNHNYDITYDHTLHSEYGHAMYYDHHGYSSPVTASLVIPKVTKLSETFRCLRFWFLFGSKSNGQLDVGYRKQYGADFKKLQTVENYKESQWLAAAVMDYASYEHEIVFRSNSDDTIFIDDIKLTDGSCSPPGACDFESGMCTWINSINATNNWFVASPSMMKDKDLPRHDVTLHSSSGSYIFYI